jgi:ADP-heptose:LPS heptosyltransferase
LKKLLLGKKNVLLFPESRRKEKVWPFFKDLVKMLSSDRRFRVVVAGAEPHRKKFSGSLDLRGKVPLDELPALIGYADLVVSNDSAPLHIASAMGRPSVSLFGPTDPVRYGPYPADSDDSVVLHAPSRKIHDLQINTVYRAVAEKLSQANA